MTVPLFAADKGPRFLSTLVALTTFAAIPGLAQPETALTSPRNAVATEAVTVLDGDTIRIDGISAAIRLVGFNAPETTRPQCEAEGRLGERAAARLRQLVSGGSLAFDRLPCACPAGAEGSQACNFGRACGRLYSRSRDVGSILIVEGLAVPFTCGPTSCPATPRPWCMVN